VYLADSVALSREFKTCPLRLWHARALLSFSLLPTARCVWDIARTATCCVCAHACPVLQLFVRRAVEPFLVNCKICC